MCGGAVVVFFLYRYRLREEILFDQIPLGFLEVDYCSEQATY